MLGFMSLDGSTPTDCDPWALSIGLLSVGDTYNIQTMSTPRWFHVTWNTYGTWLYGDPRGFRTRHHREHVEGDYRNPPPPGTYDFQYRRSHSLLRRPPVVFTRKQRALAGQALWECLVSKGVEVRAVSVGGEHVHLLAWMDPLDIRQLVGQAKKHASHELRDQDLKGTVWAKRCRPNPIKDAKHLQNTARYITRHQEEGAWVWTTSSHTARQ